MVWLGVSFTMRRKPVHGPVHSMDQDSVESLEDDDHFVHSHHAHDLHDVDDTHPDPEDAHADDGVDEEEEGSEGGRHSTGNVLRDHALSGWTNSRLHIGNQDEKASKSLIITNVDSEIFDNPVSKVQKTSSR